MKLEVKLPKPVGLLILASFIVFFAHWIWTCTGTTGELRPHAFSAWTSPFWSGYSTGLTSAREGDTIVVDYEITLESGYFSLTVEKTWWPYRRRLRHEQSRSFRESATGQLSYDVKESGLHAIWAGRYSVWEGHGRVRWSVRRALLTRHGSQHSAVSSRPPLPTGSGESAYWVRKTPET